jgi:hypothetical protein
MLVVARTAVPPTVPLSDPSQLSKHFPQEPDNASSTPSTLHLTEQPTINLTQRTPHSLNHITMAFHSAVSKPTTSHTRITLTGLPALQVTTLTHNIPWFLRQPATALIGEKCYTTLVYDFNVTDVECLKYALSKGLGFGIVLGGSIVKIPQVCYCSRERGLAVCFVCFVLTVQIIKIMQSRSTRGLSLSAYVSYRQSVCRNTQLTLVRTSKQSRTPSRSRTQQEADSRSRHMAKTSSSRFRMWLLSS